MMLALLLMALAAAQGEPVPAAGVPETLARERAAALADVRYDLSFAVPSTRTERVRGRAVIRFTLKQPGRVVLDFAQPREYLLDVRSAAGPVPAVHENGHIVVPAAFTRAGANELTIAFVAGDDALNRNDEFLYTLFVPARARFAFPCFDQPDVKARYTLFLDVPAGWEAVANGAELSRESSAPGTTRLRFAETAPLPTYLFSFVAGRFSTETADRAGRRLRIFHRETDAEKVARNRDAIFDLHATALDWLESYTAIPYPFGKFDLVLIPSFQFTGMEHPGAILYNASALLLEESATQNQRLDRASVIAHETAHMWFGDLVTMRWFNDVWMKEVFANFMAAKIVNPSFPELNHDLRFLLTHHPAAYQVDRTEGTNPIRQPLANLDEAGQLYGPIIYQKAPVVMRQLEMLLGEAGLRDGLREYLKRHAFGNASWTELVELLDARTERNLAAWSRAWVEERGRPLFATAIDSGADGTVSAITLTMTDPLGRGLVWPQRLDVTVGYAGGVTSHHDGLEVAGPPVVIRFVAGHRPLYVLPNGRGAGYGLFVLDDSSREYLLEHLEDVPDALTRGSAWVTLWENMLEGRVAPRRFVSAALRTLPREPDPQNAERVLAYVTRAFWRFLDEDARRALSPTLEATLRAGLDRAEGSTRKAPWFNALRDTALSREMLAWLERVWRREEPIPGLPLAEPDEIALALELAVRDVPAAAAVLQMQLERTANPDRKARFAFVMPALSSDPSEREQAFERLRSVENRRREPWALETLRYLNHPLREAHARRFVRPALDLLREIQQTGDIFFPTRWMDSTLYGHASPEAASTVRQFLAEHAVYPERLRWTILVTADELFRAQTLK